VCNEWIMCDSGIYPQEDKDDECGGTPEVLILAHWGDMHLAHYCPAIDPNEFNYTLAHWENEHDFWPLDKVICWQPKPPPPPGMEC